MKRNAVYKLVFLVQKVKTVYGVAQLITNSELEFMDSSGLIFAELVGKPGAAVTDKVYDTNEALQAIALRQVAAVILSKANRLDQRDCDQNLYADCHKVERFFSRFKEARGFATRYEKTATSFLAVAHLLTVLD